MKKRCIEFFSDASSLTDDETRFKSFEKLFSSFDSASSAMMRDFPTVKPFFQLVPSKETVVISVGSLLSPLPEDKRTTYLLYLSRAARSRLPAGSIRNPTTASIESPPPKKNGAAGPYQSQRTPATRLAGNAAIPRAALKIP